MAGNNPDRTAPTESAFRKLSRQPRAILVLLAAWSMLAAATQIFVNSGLFLDMHDRELDGALGCFAMGLQSIPLAVLYLFCARSPATYPNVFWLGFIHMGILVAACVYHLVIGTYSVESIVAPGIGSALLAAVTFVQVFEPKR
jgi:hypothetical protein